MSSNKQPSAKLSGNGGFFLKKYSQVIYAIVLIILIPLTILLNSIFIVRKFENDISRQLRRQALIVAELFDKTAFDTVDDIASVQDRIKRLLGGTEELRSFDILAPTETGNFQTIASSLPRNIGTNVSDRQALLVWAEDVGYAELTEATQQDVIQNPDLLNQRYWKVLFPLHDSEGKKIALLNLKMSLAYSDALFKKSLLQSWLLLIGTLGIVLALLFVNTRLLEYAISFRKLEEVNKMKDEFISMASHELRTPITAIRGYVSMFADGSFGAVSAAGAKSIAIIQASIRRLADLVEDLLDVSRIEQRRMQLSIEQIKLDEIITQTIDELMVSAQVKGLVLTYTGGATAPVSADKNKLRQVLVNLVGNAIKYTVKGSVTVSQTEETDTVTIHIKDTGIGIPAQDRDRLFTKFYRVESESTKGIVGTGLGLWITKQLVTLMGGTIYLESMENVGTEISFSLPKEKRAPAQNGAVAR